MSEKKRKIFTGEFKAKVALEAIRGVKPVNEIPQQHRHMEMFSVGKWQRSQLGPERYG